MSTRVSRRTFLGQIGAAGAVGGAVAATPILRATAQDFDGLLEEVSSGVDNAFAVPEPTSTPNPDPDHVVRRGDGWADLEVVREIVRVKGEEDVVVLARSSDRGPLLAADPSNGLPARSLTWTGFYPADQLAAFLALARAGSVRDLPVAIEPYVFPAQNLVAADAAGSIAWMPIGRAPDRHIFNPLSPGGLWLAVTMMPGRSSTPEAQ